jgi:hypothetical protein
MERLLNCGFRFRQIKIEVNITMDNIQYVIDNTGKPVSAIVPIDLWNNLERAKDILEHVYLAGLIDGRKTDTISCTLDDILKMEGLTRHGMES